VYSHRSVDHVATAIIENKFNLDLSSKRDVRRSTLHNYRVRERKIFASKCPMTFKLAPADHFSSSKYNLSSFLPENILFIPWEVVEVQQTSITHENHIVTCTRPCHPTLDLLPVNLSRSLVLPL
jgi:hypothetical protein